MGWDGGQWKEILSWTHLYGSAWGVTFFSKDSKGMTHPPLPLSSSQRYFTPNRSQSWRMSDLQQFRPVSRIQLSVELTYECFQRCIRLLSKVYFEFCLFREKPLCLSHGLRSVLYIHTFLASIEEVKVADD